MISNSTLNFGKERKAGFCGWERFLSTSCPVANLHNEVVSGQHMEHATMAIRSATKRVRGGDPKLAEICGQNALVVFLSGSARITAP